MFLQERRKMSTMRRDLTDLGDYSNNTILSYAEFTVVSIYFLERDDFTISRSLIDVLLLSHRCPFAHSSHRNWSKRQRIQSARMLFQIKKNF